MAVKAKICGLKDEAAVTAAAAAAYVGFVFADGSPRQIKPEDARTLKAKAGSAAVVAVCVDPSDDLLMELITVAEPAVIQLHGAESPERCAEVRDMYGVEVIKAIKVGGAGDVDGAKAYDGAADMLLFDGGAGDGRPFDWSLLKGASFSKPWFLAGGLTPDNVAEAVAASGAAMVDVSSGVESGPGVKDPGKIKAFLDACAAL